MPGVRGIRESVPFYGAAILCLDDENIQRILPRINRRVITYGVSAQADLRITSCSTGHMASEFHLVQRDSDLGCFKLHVPGAHNVSNATAAVAIALGTRDPHRDDPRGFGGVSAASTAAFRCAAPSAASP